MDQPLLTLIFVLVNLLLIIGIYRMFGVVGLFVWIGFSTVIANIQVVKTIEIFGFTATMGNLMYASTFLITDIISEKYGKETAKKAVWLGFFTLISMTLIMQLVLLFNPSEHDIAQDSLATIFGFLPRIALGSLLAYAVSQRLDVTLFQVIRKFFPKDSQFWIRSKGSTLISQFVDTLIFTSVAFLGANGYPADVWFEIFITTYLLKVIVSIVDTPFLFWAKKIPSKQIIITPAKADLNEAG